MANSNMMFSNNIDSEQCLRLLEAVRIPIYRSPGLYLNMPLIKERVTARIYEFLLERVRKKLCGWDGLIMSIASSGILIQTSTSTIDGYAMQISKMPVHAMDGIRQLNR